MTGTWATGWATGDIVTAAEFKKSAGSIFDTTLGIAAANIDVTSISATYAHLMITLYARSDTAATVTTCLIRFNGDTAANYDYQSLAGQGATPSAAEAFAGTSITVGSIAANTAPANVFTAEQIFIPNYANSTNNKSCINLTSVKFGTATTNMAVQFFGGHWRSNAAINRITLLPLAGNFMAGTRLTIHALGA